MSIPSEMQALPQWVGVWSSSKIPMQIRQKKAASSSDPTTWATYDEAAEAVRQGVYDQLGFVFAGNGIVGIDIDTGFEDGLMTQLCADIMAQCGSYTEKSRSGRGVHIFVKGHLPFSGRNNFQGVEIYSEKRFFIMTGKVLIFRELVENQKAIDYIVQRYFPEPVQEEREQTGKKIYVPAWGKPSGGRISLRPDYPEVPAGGRHLSLVSLAGSLWNTGYAKRDLYKALCEANQKACKPPLPEREVRAICDSITRYRRKGC